jgi:LPS export ABC transporter protein LptC
MVKNPKKYLPIAGMLLLVLVLGYFLVKPGDKGINKTAINELPPGAGITGKKLHFVEDQTDEKIKYILDADEATSSQDKKQVELSGVRLKLEPVTGPAMEIKGTEGDFNKSLNEIILKGDVQGRRTDGYSIFTEYVAYMLKEGVLKTDEPVRIIGPFFSASGRGLLFYPEKETFKIISNVTTIIDLKEGL